MQLLLLILRLLLDLLSPPGRKGLSLAARADGRVEQVPAEQALRDWWAGRQRTAAAQRAKRAQVPRASGRGAQGEESPQADAPPQ